MSDLIFQVYTLGNVENVLLNHMHKAMKFGLMLVMLMMVNLASL